MNEGDLVIPGQELGLVEQFRSGNGTYEKNGKVYASVTGKFRIDKKELRAYIEPMNRIIELNNGDIIIGRVVDIKLPFVVVDIYAIENQTREIAGEKMATLHISRIDTNYIEEIHSAMYIGDFIRGRVLQVKPSIQITTADSKLGVIKAYCRRCKKPLVKRNRALYCEMCHEFSIRKTAFDYGHYHTRI